MPKGHSTTPIINEDHIQEAARMLATRAHKRNIKKRLREMGVDNPRTMERIISEAKSILREHLAEDIKDEWAKAIAFYEGILQDPEIDPKHKLRAQENIDRLLGIERYSEQLGKPVGDDRPLVAPAIPPGAIPAMAQPGSVQPDSGGQAFGQDRAVQAQSLPESP